MKWVSVGQASNAKLLFQKPKSLFWDKIGYLENMGYNVESQWDSGAEGT